MLCLMDKSLSHQLQILLKLRIKKCILNRQHLPLEFEWFYANYITTWNKFVPQSWRHLSVPYLEINICNIMDKLIWNEV
jgi:hypothetical protein